MLDTLQVVVQRHREANEEYGSATSSLKQRCREGAAAGIPIAEVATLAEVSRQTVYGWLKGTND